MKGFLSIAAAVSLAATNVSAHYIAVQLSLGSQKFAKYEHIRMNTNYNSPVTGTLGRTYWLPGAAEGLSDSLYS